MRVIFLGCTAFSETILKELIKIPSIQITSIFTIPKIFKISYSDKDINNTNYADLKPYALNLNIPIFEVNSIKGHRITDYQDVIAAQKPDVILVMGWYYMVPKKIRNIAQHGAWGIHASLLPEYAGGAPLVWAMLEGQNKTGVTLFKLDDGVDDGDIIEQFSFDIDEKDTIKTLYDKATTASVEILKKVFGENYKIKYKPQNKHLIKVYPQRKPEDGKINWDWDANAINRFIRAQTKPYPGAWTVIGDKKVIIWDAEVTKIEDDV